ncbi:MAG: hypothetical protein DLM58_22865 [Pseudonocardiales bacterium]|nr:MAG: hypothetical protein DLM58_22865 [Pseudonocardiales bacterium]
MVTTLVLIAGAWLLIARALAVSTRRVDRAHVAADWLAAKTAPWRAMPANHPVEPCESRPKVAG